MTLNPIAERAANQPVHESAKAARETGLYPFFHPTTTPSAPLTVIDGAERINLGSNNYLGLANDPDVIEATVDAVRSYGTGLTGSRLLNGNSVLHDEMEELLCRFVGKEAALVFSTGYGANVGALTGLLAPKDAVVADREIHASLVDGVNWSGADLVRFRHNHTGFLRRRLEKTGASMCIVDGVYSMRGDMAPLMEIADLCAEFNTLLFSDEAHGLGVAGATGIGAIEAAGVVDRTDLVGYTFSKSLASCGGAILGPKDMIDAIRHLSRPFVFTAAGTPASVATAIYALRRLIDNPQWPSEVLSRSELLAKELTSHGISVQPPESAILTIEIGSDLAALGAWKALFDAGVYTNPVISPAVNPGHALLRLSVMRTHTDELLRAAAEAFPVVLPFIDVAPEG